MKTFNEYQRWTKTTAKYPGQFSGDLIYPALGLAGEVGECIEHVKKTIRDDGGKLSDERRDKLLLELGDAQYYLARLADEAGLTLEEVIRANVDKLEDRKARGKIHGSGDTR